MKIAVLGYAGSGKTYLSNYISENKSIPVLHLDSVKFTKEWKPVDDAEVLPQVADFMKKDEWIIDGYYDYLLMEERFNSADLIVLLLLPRLTCFFRALKRSKARKRNGYKNDMNWWFVRFTLFGCRNKERRRSYAEIEEKYKEKTVVLRTQRQVNDFLKNLLEDINE